VSLTECEWRSIAQKVLAQKAAAPAQSTHPIADTGTKSGPAGLNHRIDILLLRITGAVTGRATLES
jgi:hypothetical protein